MLEDSVKGLPSMLKLSWPRAHGIIQNVGCFDVLHILTQAPKYVGDLPLSGNPNLVEPSLNEPKLENRSHDSLEAVNP